MRYFLTGSGGFIGKNIVNYLGEENIISQIEEGCTVVHLAAYGNHYFQSEPDKIIKANITDLIDLIEMAVELNVGKFYNVSTSSITLPVQTMYSASKLFGETLINSLNDDRFVNVRPYSVYGIGEAQHRFIPTVIRHLKSGEKMELDTDAYHDWIFCEDFIKGMLSGYKNVGTGESYTNLQVVNFLEEISGKQLNFEKKKMRAYDNAKWVSPESVPHRSIYEGLKQTYEYYNSLT